MCDVGSCAEECEEQSASAALSDSALERLDHLLRGATAAALFTHSLTTKPQVHKQLLLPLFLSTTRSSSEESEEFEYYMPWLVSHATQI